MQIKRLQIREDFERKRCKSKDYKLEKILKEKIQIREDFIKKKMQIKRLQIRKDFERKDTNQKITN